MGQNIDYTPTGELPSGVPSYLAAVIRTGIAFGSGVLVTKGWITSEQALQLGGAAIVVFAGIWSLIQKRNANKKLKAAIVAPAGQAK